MNMIMEKHEVKVFYWNENMTESQVFTQLDKYFEDEIGTQDFIITCGTTYVCINVWNKFYYLCPGDSFVYDSIYKNFAVVNINQQSNFKEIKKEKDYIVKIWNNYLGENFQDIKTTFSYARHFKSKEEVDKVVNFLINEFNIDLSCFKIIDLNEE
jgi:hypothetical protein